MLSMIGILTDLIVFDSMTSVNWHDWISFVGFPDAVHPDDKVFSEAGHEWLKQPGIEHTHSANYEHYRQQERVK